MKYLFALAFLFVLAQTKPLGVELEAAAIHEANSYVDTLLATIRTNQGMSIFDPRSLPFHRQDVLSGGHLILSNGVATGLSTLHRFSDCRVSEESGERVIKTTIKTAEVRVVANVKAELANGKSTTGKGYTSMDSLKIEIEITVGIDGVAVLSGYQLRAPIYFWQAEFVGEYKDSDMQELLHEATDYGFSLNYGIDIGNVVTGSMKGFIENSVSDLSYRAVNQ